MKGYDKDRISTIRLTSYFPTTIQKSAQFYFHGVFGGQECPICHTKSLRVSSEGTTRRSSKLKVTVGIMVLLAITFLAKN
jgi:hypothetical protein